MKFERVLICGSRKWSDISMIACVIDKLWPKVIIHGSCAGADLIADSLARNRSIPVESYPADWVKHGKGAGHIRNAEMIKQGKPDLVVAFLKKSEENRGTKNMITQAKEAGIQVVRLEDE